MSGITEPAAAHGAGRTAALRAISRGWWLFVLRGVAAALFGIIALVFPAVGLVGLLAFIGAWMLVDGLFSLWQAFAGPADRDAGPGHPRHGRLWFALDGVLSLIAAAAIFLLPGISALALVLVAGAWWAVTGIFEIVAGVRRQSWLLGLAGAASLLLGALVLLWPGPGLLSMVLVAGGLALVFGVLLIGLGLNLRRVSKDLHAGDEGRAPGAGSAAGTPPTAATSPTTAPGATSAIAPTAVPAVDTGAPPDAANDGRPPEERGRGVA